MKNVLALTVIAGAAAVASALPQAPTVTWQVSTDGGASWSNNAVLAAAGSVMVRAQASWGDTGSGLVGLGLATAQFDGTLTGVNGTDSASSLSKGSFTPVADTQVLAYSVTSAGNGKIDLAADANAAGTGTTSYVQCGQGTQQSAPALFISANPVTFFTYTFNITGADHTVTLGSIMANSTSAMRVYLTAAGQTSSGGQFGRAAVTVQTASVQLLTPTPGSLALLGLGGLAAARRRR